jgi:hypothetical protein
MVASLVRAETPAAEATLQALDQTSFKGFTTGHAKFLALMYAPWDSASQRALREFTAAAMSSQALLAERNLAPLVFVTVRAVRQQPRAACCGLASRDVGKL